MIPATRPSVSEIPMVCCLVLPGRWDESIRVRAREEEVKEGGRWEGSTNPIDRRPDLPRLLQWQCSKRILSTRPSKKQEAKTNQREERDKMGRTDGRVGSGDSREGGEGRWGRRRGKGEPTHLSYVRRDSFSDSYGGKSGDWG